ncbi:unnamed protein product [Pleuronectes platessa]|uniref:Uncharacterized protein n=1 Tax=Pleuronectes platessa TaxID=8262 RepID=A0A9N7UYQ3_PLEPL|nr:unnamed protein product [Pleuronectes platessa]
MILKIAKRVAALQFEDLTAQGVAAWGWLCACQEKEFDVPVPFTSRLSILHPPSSILYPPSSILYPLSSFLPSAHFKSSRAADLNIGIANGIALNLRAGADVDADMQNGSEVRDKV